jgi:heme/copper-type cytochrome/quinol oxidase subunit 3
VMITVEFLLFFLALIVVFWLIDISNAPANSPRRDLSSDWEIAGLMVGAVLAGSGSLAYALYSLDFASSPRSLLGVICTIQAIALGGYYLKRHLRTHPSS